MPRSTGVTLSAVVVIIGSAFTIMMGGIAIVTALLLPRLSTATNVHLDGGAQSAIVAAEAFEAAFCFGFGGWGLASGIGLVRQRQWARISLLVFAGLLIVVSLAAVVPLLLIHFPEAHGPNLPAHFTSVMRITVVAFYGALAALGGFWLYYFNKPSVKAQFRPQHAVALAVPAAPSAAPVAALTAGGTFRPLSITIIGWFLLISTIFTLLFLPMMRMIFPGAQIPICFLGFFFFGRTALLILAGWIVLQALAAVGLLRLKRWAWFATVGTQCLAIANALLLVGIPGNRAKLQQVMDTMLASMNMPVPAPMSVFFPAWIGIVGSIPVVIVILWFLIAQRKAFAPASREFATQGR